MISTTKSVKIHPAFNALTGRIRINPPIIPLIIAMTVRGELRDIDYILL